MENYKFKKGKLYKIKFYDHCIGQDKKMICEVIGWLLQNDKKHIVITYWRVNSNDKDIKKDNVEPVSIIKSCIIKIRAY